MDKSNELAKFVKKTLDDIKSAVDGDYALEGSVDFELSVGVTKSIDGGFDIKILELGNKVSQDIIQTVCFSVRSKNDPEFKVNNIIQEKLANWLNQPNEKLLEDLNKLSANSKKPKLINDNTQG